jgi:hypothetical protein
VGVERAEEQFELGLGLGLRDEVDDPEDERRRHLLPVAGLPVLRVVLVDLQPLLEVLQHRPGEHEDHHQCLFLQEEVGQRQVPLGDAVLDGRQHRPQRHGEGAVASYELVDAFHQHVERDEGLQLLVDGLPVGGDALTSDEVGVEEDDQVQPLLPAELLLPLPRPRQAEDVVVEFEHLLHRDALLAELGEVLIVLAAAVAQEVELPALVELVRVLVDEFGLED